MNNNERNPRPAAPRRDPEGTRPASVRTNGSGTAARPAEQRTVPQNGSPQDRTAPEKRTDPTAIRRAPRASAAQRGPVKTAADPSSPKTSGSTPRSAADGASVRKKVRRTAESAPAAAGVKVTAESEGITAAPAAKPAKRQIEVEMLKPADLIISRGPVDRPLLIIIIVMLCFGCVMVFSASYAAALTEEGSSYHYIVRHIAFIGLGAAAAFVELLLLKYNFHLLEKTVPFLYIGGLGLLAYVLVYGFAQGVARRWIYLGSFSFQPSEFMKLALILALAAYLSKNQKKVLDKRFWYSSLYGDFLPFVFIAIPCLLVALENHLSGTIIIGVIGLVVIWASGARKFWFIAAATVGALFFWYAITNIEYVHIRWDAFVHPENYDATDELWQTLQGQIAVGSGGWFGVGLGNSRQKHMFVSQPQNDFIFSIICEELGFVGALAVIGLFIAFIVRGFTIALRAPDTFSALTAVGITTQVGLQGVLNMMVVVGVIPNTGISLPFFSYGGSSIIMLMVEMGILLSISRFSYQKES